MRFRTVASTAALAAVLLTPALAYEPPPRFTARTRDLLSHVISRDADLGTPTDKVGRALKSALRKAIAHLSRKATTFDRDLKEASKAVKPLAAAYPEDIEIQVRLAALVTGFVGDLLWDSTVQRATWTELLDAQGMPPPSALPGLDVVDQALNDAAILRDLPDLPAAMASLQLASRKSKGPRKLFTKFKKGEAGRRMGPGECFCGLEGGTFAPPFYFDSVVEDGFSLVWTKTAAVDQFGESSGQAIQLVLPSMPEVGLPYVPGDIIECYLSDFTGGEDGIHSLTNQLPPTGTVTFTEANPSTQTWAGTFSLDFSGTGGPLSLIEGSFRVTGVK